MRKKELWVRMPGYERFYDISNMGNIRTYIIKGSRVFAQKGTPRKLSFSPKFAYLYIGLCKGIGKQKTHTVHVLVAKAFVPNPRRLRYVNHKNGNKLDNRASNLEWCTLGENQKHAYATGLRQKGYGSKNGRCKLTDDDVMYIFNSDENHYELAARFGMGRGTIGNIKNGKIWSHLTGKKDFCPTPRIILSEDIVLKIYGSAGSYQELSKKYSVSRNVIGSIKTGRSYSDITKKKFKGKTSYTYYGIENTVGRRA